MSIENNKDSEENSSLDNSSFNLFSSHNRKNSLKKSNKNNNILNKEDESKKLYSNNDIEINNKESIKNKKFYNNLNDPNYIDNNKNFINNNNVNLIDKPQLNKGNDIIYVNDDKLKNKDDVVNDNINLDNLEKKCEKKIYKKKLLIYTIKTDDILNLEKYNDYYKKFT